MLWFETNCVIMLFGTFDLYHLDTALDHSVISVT